MRGWGNAFAVDYKALERGLKTVYVNPRRTSSRCPRCRARLVEAGYRTLRCRKCGLVGDRDVIACMNLFIKYSRCGGLGVPPERPQAR